MKIEQLKEAMQTAGLATATGVGLLSSDPALAGGCNSCDPGCTTCQTCNTGGSSDASHRTDVEVDVGVDIVK